MPGKEGPNQIKVEYVKQESRSGKQGRNRGLATAHRARQDAKLRGALDKATYDADSQARWNALKIVEELVDRWFEKFDKDRKESETEQVQETQRSFASVASGRQQPSKRSNVWQKPPSVVRGKSSSEAKPVVVPFGSFRLGVDSSDSDLDVLVLAPPKVTRLIFNSEFLTFLRADKRCSSIHHIPTAHVPVIKFEIGQIQVDLVFVRLAEAAKLIEYHGQRVFPSATPFYYEIEDSDLQDLDEVSVRSLNGARVSQMILESVKGKEETFRILLRSIRLWAKTHGLYSNPMGFLGGVNCAILAAYICQANPQCSTASELLFKFFKTFAIWSPKEPVYLNGKKIVDKPPMTNKFQQTYAMRLPAWNPSTNPMDGHHIFPILTPAYPTMNSAFNMGLPQFRRIQHEMARDLKMLGSRSKDYKELFDPCDVFKRHDYFFQIKVSAVEPRDFIEWSRFVEIKLRILIRDLECPNLQVWPDARSYCPDEPNVRYYYIGLRMKKEDDFDIRNISHDLGVLASDFSTRCEYWEGRKAGMGLEYSILHNDEIPHLQNNDLPPVKESDEVSVVTAPTTDDEDEFHSSCPKKSRH